MVGVLLLPACAAHTAQPKAGGDTMEAGDTMKMDEARAPRPETYRIEPVRLQVRYASSYQNDGRGERARCGIRVDPEDVTITYNYDEKDKDETADIEVLWKVYGLKEGHTILIVAKKDTPRGIFNTPKRYQEREAFYIDSEHNAIRSGLVERFPAEEMKRDIKRVYWKYDVVVVDENGKEMCMVDPQVVVAGHP
ncbi:MAG: hypothetical protein SX243_05245 [Acidobacteriota bacterium]|nr:hypothetical protein [Acidobacteriota bacterium]